MSKDQVMGHAPVLCVIRAGRAGSLPQDVARGETGDRSLTMKAGLIDLSGATGAGARDGKDEVADPAGRARGRSSVDPAQGARRLVRQARL